MAFSNPFAFPFGTGPEGISTEEAIDLLLQLLPAGADRLYGLLSRSGDVYNYFAAIAEAFKLYCYDMIATLRAEITPITAALKLGDYETAFGLATTLVAQSGTTAQRRTAIIAKMRESGAFTPANVRSIVGPLLGYADPSQLVVSEVNRATLTPMHEYGGNDLGILAFATASQLVFVSDDAKASSTGAQIIGTMNHPRPDLLSLTLTSPDSKSYTWPAGTLPNNSLSFAMQLNAPSLAGAAVMGNWSLSITDTSGNTGTLLSWVLFVEGIGRDSNGNDGLGGEIFRWAVYADPAKIGADPDWQSARSAVARIGHAHTSGAIVTNASAQPSGTQYPPFIPRTT